MEARRQFSFRKPPEGRVRFISKDTPGVAIVAIPGSGQLWCVVQKVQRANGYTLFKLKNMATGATKYYEISF